MWGLVGNWWGGFLQGIYCWRGLVGLRVFSGGDVRGFAAAAQPSESELPRHRGGCWPYGCVVGTVSEL